MLDFSSNRSAQMYSISKDRENKYKKVQKIYVM